MPIKCQICNKEFNKQITNSHLKKHGITTSEYKLKYGKDSLSSPEYRLEKSKTLSGENNPNYGNKWTKEQKQNLSQKAKGRKSPMKGVSLSEDHKEKIRQSIAERLKNGYEVWNKGREWDEDTKQKISNAVKKYALENKEQLSDRAHKAIKTKKEKGVDLAFFRGRKHTSETKQKISLNSKQYWTKEKESIILKRISKLKSLNISIVNDPDEWYLLLECNKCNHRYIRPRNYFYDSYCDNLTNICPTSCPNNKRNRSRPELDLNKFLIENNINVLHNVKDVIWPFELDLYLPDHNLAIEYCGLYWHSELCGKTKNYHKDKMELCNSKGITLLTIFEDEWLQKPDIVKSRLLHKVNNTKKTIYARECIARRIENKTAKKFLTDNHIQGPGKALLSYGLIHNSQIVSVMTFIQSELTRQNEWELNRFASLNYTNIPGAAGKLFKLFLFEYNPKTVTTYSDLRWNSGRMYELLGFKFDNKNPPTHWYIKGQTRLHRSHYDSKTVYTKDILKNHLKEGKNFIWDCGHNKWVWKRK